MGVVEKDNNKLRHHQFRNFVYWRNLKFDQQGKNQIWDVVVGVVSEMLTMIYLPEKRSTCSFGCLLGISGALFKWNREGRFQVGTEDRMSLDLSVACRISWLKDKQPRTRTLAAYRQMKSGIYSLSTEEPIILVCGYPSRISNLPGNFSILSARYTCT